MIKILFIPLFSILFAVYSEGDLISSQHQEQVNSVCAGGMINGQGEDLTSLSLGEYVGKVIWINFSASW